MSKEKNGYEVLPWHGRGWHCYSYLDRWGNYHSEVEIPWNDVIADVGFNGGYGHDTWAATYYLLNTGEVINSSFYGSSSYCRVYKDETARIKSIIMGLWSERSHPMININDLEQFKEKFPLTYKIIKYLYCRKHLRWISVKIYDKRYENICD
jgi:hypothetical protein